MIDKILMVNDLMNETDAEKIIDVLRDQQKKIIDETGSAARVAYSEAANSLLPLILAGCGVHTCVFPAFVDEVPDGFCYISSGIHRVLAYKLKDNETLADLADMHEKIAESMPDFPVFTSAGLNECSFAEKENPTDIYISEDNIKISAIKECDDGSGDTILRVFEKSDSDKNETHAFITSDALDCGFWLDIRKNEVKTFRVGGEIVRETNFIEGMIPFDTMID